MSSSPSCSSVTVWWCMWVDANAHSIYTSALILWHRPGGLCRFCSWWSSLKTAAWLFLWVPVSFISLCSLLRFSWLPLSYVDCVLFRLVLYYCNTADLLSSSFVLQLWYWCWQWCFSCYFYTCSSFHPKVEQILADFPKNCEKKMWINAAWILKLGALRNNYVSL